MNINEIPEKVIGSELSHEEFNTLVKDTRNKLYGVPNLGDNYDNGDGIKGVVVYLSQWEDDALASGIPLPGTEDEVRVTIANHRDLIDTPLCNLDSTSSYGGNLPTLADAQMMLDKGIFTFVADTPIWGAMSNGGNGYQQIIWLNTSGVLEEGEVNPLPNVLYNTVILFNISLKRHNWKYVLPRVFNLNNLEEYANNTAALAAGLLVGEYYHTAGSVKMVI